MKSSQIIIETPLVFMIVCLLMVILFSHGLAAEAKSEKIDKIVIEYFKNHQLNGVVLVAEKGNIIYRKAYGYADFGWAVKNRMDTIFRIYSASKQFTAMVIMQLAQEGKINLNEPITAYLPYYRKDTGDKITIHHLLTHSHGIPDPPMDSMPLIVTASPEDVIKTYFSENPMFEPGAKFSYSGVGGYTILGAIAEKVSGKTLKELLKERIFNPLGMKNSHYYDVKTIIKRKAKDYRYEGDQIVNRLQPYYIVSAFGASCIVTTADDLYKWDRALYTNKLLSPDFMKRYLKPHISMGGNASYAYGQGVSCYSKGEEKRTVYWHSGGTASYIFRDVDKQHLILIINNIRNIKSREIALKIHSLLE
jgi:CubicO group peptidase (beta-lactamase class C family)